MAETIRVPIAKGGRNVFIDVSSEELNEAFDSNPGFLSLLIAEGLKTVLNSRMSKLAAPSKLEGSAAEDNKTAALAQAAKNLADAKSGALKKKAAAGKDSGLDRATQTEALRLAKDAVKDQIRKAGMKISHVSPKQITEAAKKFVETQPEFIEKAKENLAARAEIKVDVSISDLISVDPTLVAKAEKEAAERKDERQLSAKQAGKTIKHGSVKVPPRRGDAPHTSH